MLLEINQGDSGFSSRHEIGWLVPDDGLHSARSENEIGARLIAHIQPSAAACRYYSQIFACRELHHFAGLFTRSRRHFERALGAEMIAKCN